MRPVPTTCLLAFAICGFASPELVTAQTRKAPKGPVLTVNVVNVKATRGHMQVAVYGDSKKDWLEDRGVLKTATVVARKGKTQVKITGLRPGTYAVAVFHDENRNKELDTNLVGIPTEGYGFSLNPGARFGPPSLRKARFVMSAKGRAIDIELNHWP